VVVPVFNNSLSLDELNQSLTEALEGLRDTKCEIVYVDDGSLDDSLNKLEIIKKSNGIKTKLVQLAGNFGQVNAILAGVDFAENELVATISADLQDPPEIIVQMHESLGLKGRIAIAERETRDDSNLMSWASRIVYGIMRLQNKKIPKSGFDCWMMDLKIARYVLNKSRISDLRQMNFFNSGNEVFRISYKRRKRIYGKSGYKFSKKFQMFIEIIVMSLGNLASYLVIIGFAIALFTLFLFFLILYSYLQNKAPFQGFTLIAGLITLIGSFLLIALGAVLLIVSRQGSGQPDHARYVVEKAQ
jgi:glycosyltransferase involved in cell wall biosynthesis